MTWDDLDTRLAMALTVLEAETCKRCGTPGWIGHSTDNRILFSVESSTCYGCAQLEEHDHKQHKTKQSSPGFGKRYRPQARMFDDSELPTRHEEYQRRQDRSG